MFPSFINLLWSYYVAISEPGCLAKVAKPYLVSRRTYLLEVPNQLHCITKSAHEMLITICFPLSH